MLLRLFRNRGSRGQHGLEVRTHAVGCTQWCLLRAQRSFSFFNWRVSSPGADGDISPNLSLSRVTKGVLETPSAVWSVWGRCNTSGFLYKKGPNILLLTVTFHLTPLRAWNTGLAP